MPRAERSLVNRVALVTAAAAAVAALVAAALASTIAERIVADADDRRLYEHATIVLREIPEGADRDALRASAEEEGSELKLASVRLAVWEDDTFIAGDRALPDVPDGQCVAVATDRDTLHACAASRDRLRIVVAATRAASGLGAFFGGCLAAAALAAAIAGVASRRAARWALAPLTRLRVEVEALELDQPTSAGLASTDASIEVAALRTALVSLVDRLAQELDRARRFSSEAAHELRTPLTTISAELDLLAEEQLDDATHEAVGRLRRRTATLARLVERLLSLASARDAMVLEAVALEDVVRDVHGRLAQAARDRVLVHVDAFGTVRGDETLLAALVENAVENALKYSGHGQVDVRIGEVDGGVLVDIQDDGPGISAADRVRAFEPFFRAASSRASRTEGSGVGLALVARIATLHGGEAAFVDAARGAHLRITLPAWSSVDDEPVS